MTADCFHLNNDSGCLKGLKSRSVWRETEREREERKGSEGKRKDGNKREEEEEEEMRRGEREVEEGGGRGGKYKNHTHISRMELHQVY